MDIPKDLVYKVINIYKEDLDGQLVGILMDRELHIRVFGKSQACLNILQGLDSAIEKWLKDNGMGEEE